jgi:hypothetical protein
VKLMVQPQDGVKPLIDGIHRARSPNSGRVTGNSYLIVLLKGMSSEKHFSLAERQKYFPASSPPTTLPTPLFLQLLDRSGLSRSGPISRGAMGPRCYFHLGVSCSLA